MVTEYHNGDVGFRFFRRGVRNVFLCGEFNGWSATSLPMVSTGDGWWGCQLRLAPGSYQFKYCADGEWFADGAAFGVMRSPLGAWNSVVLVKARPHDAGSRRTQVADMAEPSQAPQVVSALAAGSPRPFSAYMRSGWASYASLADVPRGDSCEPGLSGVAVRHRE